VNSTSLQPWNMRYHFTNCIFMSAYTTVLVLLTRSSVFEKCCLLFLAVRNFCYAQLRLRASHNFRVCKCLVERTEYVYTE
jgi:hypothetical protein